MQVTMSSARVNAGLSQRELCGQMGISQATLIKWEKGRREPKVSQLRKFCEIVGCDISDIRFEESD